MRASVGKRASVGNEQESETGQATCRQKSDADATASDSAKEPVLARTGSDTGRATCGQKSDVARTASGSVWERVSSRGRK
jgi:hypothetical protein